MSEHKTHKQDIMDTQTLRYQSYLLRCWQECDKETDTPIWRFSLEDPRTGKRLGFTNLLALTKTLETDLLNPRENACEK